MGSGWRAPPRGSSPLQRSLYRQRRPRSAGLGRRKSGGVGKGLRPFQTRRSEHQGIRSILPAGRLNMGARPMVARLGSGKPRSTIPSPHAEQSLNPIRTRPTSTRQSRATPSGCRWFRPSPGQALPSPGPCQPSHRRSPQSLQRQRGRLITRCGDDPQRSTSRVHYRVSPPEPADSLSLSLCPPRQASLHALLACAPP
jgi:hypothetical protein